MEKPTTPDIYPEAYGEELLVILQILENFDASEDLKKYVTDFRDRVDTLMEGRHHRGIAGPLSDEDVESLNVHLAIIRERTNRAHVFFLTSKPNNN
mgnify:CR=1 FL=1